MRSVPYACSTFVSVIIPRVLTGRRHVYVVCFTAQSSVLMMVERERLQPCVEYMHKADTNGVMHVGDIQLSLALLYFLWLFLVLITARCHVLVTC